MKYNCRYFLNSFVFLEPNKTYNYSYTIFYGKGCKIVAATDTFTTSPECEYFSFF